MAEEFVVRGILDLTDAESRLAQLRAQIAQLNAASAAGNNAALSSGQALQQQINNFQQNIGQINNVYLRQLQNNTNQLGIKIRQLGFALQRLGVQGSAAAGELVGAFGAAGLAIGAVTLGALAAAKAISTLVKTGVSALKELAVASFDTGKEVQNSLAQFTAFYEGNIEAARATIDEVFGLSREFGLTGGTELARALLPVVGSLEDLDAILKIGASLVAQQPEQAPFLRQALQDLAVGQTRSAEQRFEIPRAVLTQFREVFQEDGAGEAFELIQDYLEETGRSIENFANTADFQLGKLQARYQILQAIVGEPLVLAITDELKEIVDLVDANEGAFQTFGAVFGESLGAIVGDLSTIAQIIVDDIVAGLPEIGNTLATLAVVVDQAALLTQSLGGSVSVTSELAKALNVPLFAIQRTIQSANVLLYTLKLFVAPIVAMSSALEQVKSGLSNIAQGGIELLNQWATLTFSLVDAAEALGLINEGIGEIGGAGAQILSEINEAASENLFVITDVSRAYDDLDESIDDYLERLAESNALGRIAANVFLGMREATGETAENLDDLNDALDKVNDAVRDFNIDVKRDLEDQTIKEERARADLEEEFAQKREDIQREHGERIADISNDFFEDRLDALKDLSRDEEDILRKAGRRTVDLEKEIAKDRAKIEEDLQAELDRINRRFDFTRREAIRDNDAVAFVRNEERRQFELNEARIRYQTEVDDAREAAEEKRQALADQLAREIEDAEIANKRKLEDLITTLRREISEEGRRYDMALAEQDRYEQQKRDSQKEDFARERADLEKAWERRLDDLGRRYEDELALISQYQNREYQLVFDHQRRMAELVSQGFGVGGSSGFFAGKGGSSGFSGGDGDGSKGGKGAQVGPTVEELRSLATSLAFQKQRQDLLPIIAAATREQLLDIIASLGGSIPITKTSTRTGGGNAGTPRRDGGPVFAGRDYLFEGREPEVIRFGQHGRVVPMRLLPNGALGGGGGGASTVNNINVDQSMLDPSSLSPAQRAIMKQLAVEIINEMVDRL